MKCVTMSLVTLLILPGFFFVQGKGLIDISSKPTGVDIYIDGENKGVTPLALELPIGAHRLRAEKEGYGTVSQSITVTAEPTELEIDLSRLPEGKTESEKRRRSPFVDNGDGTATDSRAGLMWTRTDNGNDIDWNGADAYCLNLSLAGFGDWRMATIEELGALFSESRKIDDCMELKGRIVPCYIREPFTLSGIAVWSSERIDSSSAWVFSFYLGDRAVSPLDRPGSIRRVLCVRRSGAQ